MAPSEESYRLIPLTQGQFAIVDVEDFEHLSQWKWCANWNKKRRGFYAQRREYFNRSRSRIVYMHRAVMGLTHGDPRHVDHRAPGSTLDNRRSNLRIATASDNQHNRGKNSNNTSGFKGVSFNQGRFHAKIWLHGKQIHLGSRRTAEEAFELYCAAAKKYHGEFARVS